MADIAGTGGMSKQQALDQFAAFINPRKVRIISDSAAIARGHVHGARRDLCS